MGYLASGYAFGAAPDWDGLRSALAAFELRGYKHKTSPLTLLDVWKPGREQPKRHAFTGPPLRPGELVQGAAQSAVEIAFDAVCDALREGEEHVPYEAGWLGVPLRIAAAARTATLAFAADDDTYDSAALVRAGALIARCRVGLFDVTVEGGAVTVLPYIDEESEHYDDEDGEDEAHSAVLDALTSLPNVRVLEPRKVAGGFRIYQHPSDLWPAEWGDAEKLLGFGTFDPFLDFEAAFEPVFEAAPSRGKPWWKLWS